MKVYRKREDVSKVAEKVSKALTANGIKSILCGSLRRGCTEVSDVDMVVDDIQRAMVTLYNGFSTFRLQSKKVKKMARARIYKIPFGFYEAGLCNWGAMTLFLTGDMKFNITMRTRAKQLRLKLNQYGLWRGEDLIAAKTEELIFNALGLQYIEPGEREGRQNGS